MLVSDILLELINKGIITLILGGLDGYRYIWNLRQLNIYQYTSVAIIGHAKLMPSLTIQESNPTHLTCCPVIYAALPHHSQFFPRPLTSASSVEVARHYWESSICLDLGGFFNTG